MSSMTRLLPVSGILAVAMGFAWLIPAGTAGLDRENVPSFALVLVGPVFMVAGLLALWLGFRDLRLALIPAPVRAVIMGNVLFVAFCSLEFSDGLLRQGGRIVYWTSILFLPAVAVFYGQVLARRWAWWVARVATGLLTLWFIGFLLIIPFAPLKGNGGAIPWWGRIYVTAVTLAFTGVSAYAFRSLGRIESRKYYGLPTGPDNKACGAARE